MTSSPGPPGSHQTLLPAAWGVWCLGPPRAASAPLGSQTLQACRAAQVENLGYGWGAEESGEVGVRWEGASRGALASPPCPASCQDPCQLPLPPQPWLQAQQPPFNALTVEKEGEETPLKHSLQNPAEPAGLEGPDTTQPPTPPRASVSPKKTRLGPRRSVRMG